jgi:zinc protease
MEDMGADNNASTWLDFTQYQECFPKAYLKAVVDLEARRMNQLVLREPQVMSEKEVVKNERRYRVEDDVDGAAEELLYKTAFRRHPYHAPTIGFMEDIDSFTPEDCRDFYRAYYAPNNATLVLVGDFDETRALRVISQAYGTIPPSDLPAEDIQYDPPQTAERRVEIIQPTTTEKLIVGYKGPSLGDADHLVSALIMEILTGGRASRLNRRLVRKDQIASEVSGFAGPHRDPSLLEISAAARSGSTAEQLLSIIDEELERLTTDLVEASELERVRARMEFSLLSGMETAEGKASALGFYEAVLRQPTAGAERLRLASLINTGDIRRVARRFLRKEARTIILVRPQEGPEDEGARS